MDTQKLNRWAELLLDTGKRNNLVNFKDTKTSSVEVLFPNTATLFSKAENSPVFEVYDPKLADDKDELEETDASLPAVSENAITDGAEPIAAPEEVSDTEDPARAAYLREHIAKVRKQSQILLYNSAANPLTALKSIHKRAASAIEETGVNVAYMAFGFIHWKESADSQLIFRAPILLAPVLFENESAIEPYQIRMTEDDVIVNPTFSFKLHAEYNVTLPPLGEESFEEYIAKVSDTVTKLGWSVSTECKIGIFSFLKINMYQDLKENAETILENDNVRRLLGEPVEDREGDTESGTAPVIHNILVDLHNVVDADSSQLEAIRMAKEGKSFVLQGPPGTGKSQTITNILAECLSDGKKVLFVSEKLAALNVVYEKLKQAGLEEFCLELHSHKANKKDVIADLCQTIRKAPTRVKEEAAAEISAKIKAQKQLDTYAAELHKPRPVVGKSLFQLISAHAALNRAEDIDYMIPEVDTKDENYLNELCALLDQYSSFISTIGYDYRSHAWLGFCKNDLSQRARLTLQNDLEIAEKTLRALSAVVQSLKEAYGLPIDDLRALYRYHEFLQFYSESDVITPSLLSASAVQTVQEALSRLIPAARDIVTAREALSAEYDSELYALDGADLHKQLTRRFDSIFSRLFNGDYRRIIQDIRLCRKDGKKVSYAEAVRVTRLLADYRSSLEEFETVAPAVASHLGPAYVGVDSPWERISAEVTRLSELLPRIGDLGSLPTVPIALHRENQERVAAAVQSISEIRTRDGAILEAVSGCFDPLFWDLYGTPFEAAIRKCAECPNKMDTLENWCRFYDLLVRLHGLNALTFIHYLIDHGLASHHVSDIYRRAYYSQQIESIIYMEPSLAGFSRIAQDKAVRTFAEKDEHQFGISRARIKAELSSMRPPLDMMAAGSATSILLREGEKKRKQKSIRTLLSEIGDLIQVIKPCFLMSPLSVSTFLSASGIRFDVIVFDEASQIFPQDAVGAIYRGKQLIVVGDSRQMPPSNFFNTTVEVEDTDEESGDVTDFESILDICSTTFPQIRLKWHYRSRYEQLISFSNKNFYDNDLITFPSVKADRPWIGVDYHYVDGTFDHRSKANRKEAEYIVDLIYKNIDMYPERSLGVVAFSVSQQDLIDKLLSKRRQACPEREYFFRSDRKEPFFIKNLETVQGDERDTVIFSVGYAKDAQGKLLHNFGPLNRAGGERRLNVAVTRAKINVQLVSSLHHTDIDLNRTKADGARLLKEYLDYAENGPDALLRSITLPENDSFDSSFEQEVCQFLRGHGYTVDTQVGCSGFRIDLGLRLPDSSDYVLAIECDGASYHASHNARDRDRLRQEILERMGWRFYRIWSTDWFKNKRTEQERLLTAVADAIHAPKNSPPPPSHTVDPEPTFDLPAEVKHFEFPVYKEVSVTDIYYSTGCSYLEAVLKVLKTEAPLSEEWLLKRSVEIFDREKVTSVVITEYREAMTGHQRQGIAIRDGFLYLQGQTNYQLRVPAPNRPPREIRHIALEELAAGMYEIIRQNISLDKTSLFHLLAGKLSFTRAGNAIQERLERALSQLRSVVDISGDTISLK